jgi:hypothetical protein
MGGFWRMQLGYAVIRRSTRIPRLWWRQVRLNIIWEVFRGECSRLEARKVSGGVCEYLEQPGAMVDFGCALVEVRDGLPKASLLRGLSIARLLDEIRSLDAPNC